MKKCPFCAAQIQERAIKCRYCAEMLPEKAAPAAKSAHHRAVLLGLVLLLLLAVAVAVKRHYDRVQQQQVQVLQQAHDRFRLQALETKATAAFEAYKKDTSETLDEISKIDAATETGLNLRRYSDLLGEVNYRVRKYKDEYDARVEHLFPSYMRTVEAMDAYVVAGTAWQMQNQDEDAKDRYEQQLQAAWALGSESTRRARTSFKSAAGAEEWRHPAHYLNYLRQVSGSESEAQFATAHQQSANQQFSHNANLCESNQKALETAMEIWSSDHEGRYPAGLTQLLPKYIKQIPICPANGEYNLESTGQVGPPDQYTLQCSGLHPRLR